MGRTKGSQKTPGSGRKAGTPNKLTGEVRQMILTALEEAGGVDYLKRQATENPSAFLTLIGKIIPGEVKAEIGNTITIVMDAVDADA